MEAKKTGAVLRLKEVQEIIGRPKSAIYRMMARGEFPLPIREGILSHWVPAEIDAWLMERCDRPRVGPKLADGVTPWQPKATAGEGEGA